MKEIKAIVSTYKNTPENEKVALATVVRVEGSSYRRMGARMLISENGTWVGGISGGCLEGDALKRARLAIIRERASIITYDTSGDDEHQIGVGLGCNGIIDVLFKPIRQKNNPIEVLQTALNPPRKIRKLISISHCKNKLLLGDLIPFLDEESLSPLKSFCDTKELFSQVNSLEKSKNLIVNDSLTIFIEVVNPPIHLILFGHQYDLYPLIQQANELGWEITVIAPLNKIKPSKMFNSLEPNNLKDVFFDKFTAAILMSHSLETDKENLKNLIQYPLKYIGMLGPRVRAEKIFKALSSDGIPISDSIGSNIYAPTGLDLGANNPDEIALSILAEIKAVFSNRNGASLRDRKSPIHLREQAKYFN